MSDKPSTNEQLDSAKRYAAEIVEDMRSKNLLLPAIVIVVAIVVAMVLLPNRDTAVLDATPIAPVPTKPIANQTPEPMEITLIKPDAIGDNGPLSDSRNPFRGTGSYTCKTVRTGPPKVLDCLTSGLEVRVFCPLDLTEPPCGDPETTAAGEATGSTGAGGGSTPETGGGGAPVEITVYRATVRLDGRTYRNLDQGDNVPPSGTTVAKFETVSKDGKTASFRLAEGSTARSGGSYTIETKNPLMIELKKGRSATITDAAGKVHTLKLQEIRRTKV